MKILNKKVLITGGGRGIGFSIAKAFAAEGGQVILSGRNEDTLKKAVAGLKGASYIVADVANGDDVAKLADTIGKTYGGLDILVNNAGVAVAHRVDAEDGVYETAKYEIEINYLGVLRLTEKLLPYLKASKDAAIINVESVVSYLPNAVIPTYSATKAALHSYSQSLRLTLQQSNPHVKVFEVFPPFVDTDLTKGFEADKLSPEEVAADIVAALGKEEFAIRNGITKEVYKAFHHAPEEFLVQFNSGAGRAV